MHIICIDANIEHNTNISSHQLTATCLLCLSIQYVSWTLIRATASYQSDNAGSTPSGGQWFLPPLVSRASILESMLHKACCSSLFLLLGGRFKGFAFAMNDTEALRAPSVFTWTQRYTPSAPGLCLPPPACPPPWPPAPPDRLISLLSWFKDILHQFMNFDARLYFFPADSAMFLILFDFRTHLIITSA
jgi:hypothetical protein